MTRQPPLPTQALRWRCDPERLGFQTTEEVPPLEATVGQDRGVEAIGFGLHLDTAGYNVYVAGPTGTGRTTTVRNYVAEAAQQRPAPPDWCYVHDFRNPSQPIAVQLATGQGPGLAREMDELIADCRREIPKVFESDQYQQRRAALVQRLQEQRDAVFQDIRTVAEQLGFAIQVTPMGIATVPLLAPGRPITPETFELLSDERKADIRQKSQQIERKVEEALLGVRRLERETHEQLHALDREAVGYAVGHLLDALRVTYAGTPRVVEHLDAVQADLVEHLDQFRATEPDGGVQALLTRPHAYERYRVNVLVTHEPTGGAPVVFEPNPTYYNLLGRIDYRVSLGAMETDVTLVKPGALHRANGGFLVLQARDLLVSPFAWDVLKRSLRDQEIRVENLGEQWSAFPTASLKPQPIALNVKVILIGDLLTHGLLYHLDEDFHKLFKVKAQFGPYMDRSDESIRAYASFVSNQVRLHGLVPFGKDAVARIVEHGARLADHQDRLSTEFDAIAELVVEADFRARQGQASVVSARHVDEALVERERRLNLLEEELQRTITEGTIAIDTRAKLVGQVNGLSVVDLGDYVFARPSRITAQVGMGFEGVINLEREVELSGPLHSKGVLVLSGYLLGAYAQEIPLALSARVTFEQVYGEVEGDSASSAELYALLSSLSGLPIAQGVAVTGSVNQYGYIQSVGGVSEKIEGFFVVCKAQGLTGEQGVIVPEANMRHLMLAHEVLDAIDRHQFHVWAVSSVDQGIELLTGVAAGIRAADGSYPPGTVHARVQERLSGLATRLAEFGNHDKKTHGTGLTGISSPNGRKRLAIRSS